MIHQNHENEKTEKELNTNFIAAIKDLKISKLLSQCGIRKDARKIKGESSKEKRTAFEIFQFLLLLVFSIVTSSGSLDQSNRTLHAQRVPITVF